MFLTLAMLACTNSDTPNINQLEPEIELPNEEINFDEVVAGSQQVTANLTVRNVGRGLLVFDSIELTDGTPDVYTLGTSHLMELDRDEETQIAVTYTPDSTLQHLGGLRLVSNDPDRPEITVDMTGYGVAPAISIDPQTLWYEEVEPGDKLSLQVRIEARGQGALKVSEILFEDDAFAEAFELKLPESLEDISDDEPHKIEPGGSITFDVEFAPSDFSPWDGRLLIRSNDPDTPTADVRLLANTDYEGKEPPTVEILTPDWGNYFTEGEEVLLEGNITDDSDSPQSMSGSWYATTEDGGRVWLSTQGIDSTGYTTATAVLPPGEPVTLELQATDSLGSTGKDTLDVTVWEEEIPVPYTISGGSDIFTYWSVDDDVTIYLDGEPIFSDSDHTSSSHPPVEFEALAGQEIRIVVNDVNACDAAIDALTLHWGTSASQPLNGAACASSCDTHACYDGTYNGPWPSVFLDETYVIEIP